MQIILLKNKAFLIGTAIFLLSQLLHAENTSNSLHNELNNGPSTHNELSPTLLQLVTLSDLPQLLTEKCALIGVPPYPSALDLESLLLELNHIYRDEPTVLIGQFPYHSNSSDQILWSKTPQTGVHIALYERQLRDRECLLSPQRTKFRALPYSGQINLAVLVQFINEKCSVFRTPRGTLTPEGLYHQHLIESLYVPEQPSQHCAVLEELPTREEFFNRYLLRSRPVVIRNAYKDFAPMKKWTQRYLRQLYGRKNIHIKLTPDGIFEGVESAKLWRDYHDDRIPPEVKSQLEFPDLVVVRPATSNMLFSDFLDLISAGNASFSAYLEYSSIPYYMTELESDVEELPFVAGLLERRQLNMWLSDGNTLGKLHFDPFDNFLCQLSGEKHLTLFDPHSNENLYEAHIPEAILTFNPSSRTFSRDSLLESTSMVMSPVDITSPDSKRFPKFSDTHRVKCVLKAGDVLFMPAFWWHEVQSFPDSVERRNLAINFWYEPVFTKEFPCPSCRLHYNMLYKHFLREPV